MKKIIFRVDGMECPNCAIKLEGMEDRLAGIKFVEASYRKGQMVVEFDDLKVNEAQIIEEAMRLGYSAAPVEK